MSRYKKSTYHKIFMIVYSYNCIFTILNTPINVFGNSSNNSDNKIDTNLFVQKPYLRSKYIKSNIEEIIDVKNQYRVKNLPDPISIREGASKIYVDNKFNGPSIIKNTEHFDLNHRNITNARFIQVDQLHQIDSHLTAELYVDNSIDEPLLVRNNQDKDFGNYNLTIRNSITLNTQAVKYDYVITKAYVDQFHEENERSRRDLGIDFSNESSDLVKNNQDNDFNDNKLKNLDSVAVNRNPVNDNELTSEIYVDNQLNDKTTVRFNQSLQNSLKVSIGYDTSNLTENDRINITVIIEMRNPNKGKSLLQNRTLKCINKNKNAKINTFLKSTTNTSPTAESRASSVPPIGWAFMYVESSSNNHGPNHVMFS